MTITIKEKITEALENYRDAAEPLELFRALGLNDKDQFAAAVQELEQEGVLVATKKGRLLSVKSAGPNPRGFPLPARWKAARIFTLLRRTENGPCLEIRCC